MKKTILSLAFLCILAISSQAQGLYFGGSVGYGLRAGGSVIGTNQNSDGSSEVVRGSYGAGFSPTLSAGYLFNKNLGAELGIGYLFGTMPTVTDNFGNTTGTTDYTSKSFYLNPSFVIRAGEGKVVPYGKMGIFLGLGNNASIDDKSTRINGNSNNTTVTEDKITYKGGIATGLTAAFGVDFMLSDNLAIFGELSGRLASYSPTSRTDDQTVTNNNNNVTVVTSSSTNYNIVDSQAANYTGTDRLAGAVFPFSSIGLNVGVRFYLSK